MENFLLLVFLNEKIIRMKLKEDIVISSKSIDRNKTFASLWNMKNVLNWIELVGECKIR